MEWPMKEAHAELLLMSQPKVVVQGLKPDDFETASYCVSEGWLNLIRDKPYGQSEYRITPKGIVAIAEFRKLKA